MTKSGIPEPPGLSTDEFREWVQLCRAAKRGTLYPSDINLARYAELQAILDAREAWLGLPLDEPPQPRNEPQGPLTYEGD